MYNHNWDRWINASICSEIQRDLSKFYPCFVEGSERDTTKLKNYFELRLDGVHFKEGQRDNWFGELDVNILCSAVITPRDIYILKRLKGLAAASLKRCIRIFKHGDGPDDDGNLLEIAQRESQDRYGGIRVNDFGKIETDVPLMQATVEATYKIEIYNGTD